MRTSPRPLRTSAGLLTATLAALLSVLLVTGSFAPAEAAPGAVTRKISAKPSATSAPARGSVVVSGTVSPAAKGIPVRVQRRAGKKWVAVRSTRTTGAGAYSTRVPLPSKAGNYLFRALTPARAGVRAATSRSFTVAALNPVIADMGALPSMVPAGTHTTFFGTVQPYVAGTTVSFQRQVAPNRWATVATSTLDSVGGFSKGVAVLTAGSYRAFVPRVGRNAATYSPTIEVRTTPVIATTALADGFVGTPYDVALAAVGDPAGTWSASPLPAGIVLDAATGRLSGTPSTNGDTTVQIDFIQASTGFRAPSRTLTVHVTTPTPPEITTTALPAGTRLSPYSLTLTAADNPAGSWTATPLPAGLTLNGSTGVISGTPTATGDTSVEITFNRTHPVASAHKTLVLHVNQAAAPVISTSSLPDGGYDAAYSARLVAAGDPAGSWTASGLPAGLILNTTTGVISGTPTASGTATVSIRFTEDRTGLSASKSLPLKVNALPVISTSTLAKGVATRAYAEQLRAAGDPAGTWSIPSLPEGLTLNPTTGAIGGAPTTAATTQLTITFTETATGLSASKTLPLVVNQAPVISTSFLPDGGIGNFYSTTLLAAGGPEGTWTATPLPAGLNLNQNTGAITGTPTAAGTTAVVVTFTQTSTGVSSTKTLNLLVNPRPVIETSSLPNAKVGTTYKNSDGTAVTLRAVGGVTGTWTVSGLPAGLTYDTQTGVISGTPDSLGFLVFSKDFTLTLNFTQGSTGVSAIQKTVTLTVTV